MAEEFLVKHVKGDGTVVGLVQEYNGPKSRLFLLVERGDVRHRRQVNDDSAGRALVMDARADPEKYLAPPAEPEPVVHPKPEPVTAAAPKRRPKTS